MPDPDAVSAVVNECTTTSHLTGCQAKMAPSPDNDTAPKAPDKAKTDGCAPGCPKEKGKQEKTVWDLNDRELKALLDEAANYKNPKDREGKSRLFNCLLNEAEQDERNARAARAGGSELVRYCNPSAKRNSRHRKKPSSISENMMHGGSLDNLAKEELFETSKHRTKKSVSARQREGGSLPSNVNATIINNVDYHFLEEARKNRQMREKPPPIDLEAKSLLEHDFQSEEIQPIEFHHFQVQPAKYTSRATLQVNNVDDLIQVAQLETATEASGKSSQSKTNPVNKYMYIPSCISSSRILDDGKKVVDENGNALQQNSMTKIKKKKAVSDKKVVVCVSQNVKGHRADIIHDVDKLMEFIGVPNDQSSKNNRSNLHKSKQLNRHTSEDSSSKSGKKQRAQSSKSKEDQLKLKKSNSLGEISTASLDDFAFDKEKVVGRNNKNTDKPRERRSWGNMELQPIQHLYSNASAENLETAEFREVIRKKKSKKRRNSVSGRTKTSSISSTKGTDNRCQSPDLRRKSASSVPHSEKSNDSSDVDSVHSLPIDTQRIDLASTRLKTTMSYAEMAKNGDGTKPKEKKSPIVSKEAVDSTGKVQNYVNQSNLSSADSCPKINTPPDVHNIKSFPAISKPKETGQGVVAAASTTTTSSPIPATPVVAMSSAPPLSNVPSKNNPKTCKSAGVNTNVNKNVQSNVKTTTTTTTTTVATVAMAASTLTTSAALPAAVTPPSVSVVAAHNVEYQHCIHNDISVIEAAEKDSTLYSASLPPDIPDVQTIEKMQLIGQGHHRPYEETTTTTTTATGVVISNMMGNLVNVSSRNQNNNRNKTTKSLSKQNSNSVDGASVDCDNSDRTTTTNVVDTRPPVVILSGSGNEVPGLEFGFDVNEQLLSEDGAEGFNYEEFAAKFIPPKTYTTTSHNYQDIVDFVAAAWEETVTNVDGANVLYYSDSSDNK